MGRPEENGVVEFDQIAVPMDDVFGKGRGDVSRHVGVANPVLIRQEDELANADDMGVLRGGHGRVKRQLGGADLDGNIEHDFGPIRQRRHGVALLIAARRFEEDDLPALEE